MHAWAAAQHPSVARTRTKAPLTFKSSQCWEPRNLAAYGVPVCLDFRVPCTFIVYVALLYTLRDSSHCLKRQPKTVRTVEAGDVPSLSQFTMNTPLASLARHLRDSSQYVYGRHTIRVTAHIFHTGGEQSNRDRERDRERERGEYIYIYMHTDIYIYIYTYWGVACIYMYMYMYVRIY